MAKSKKPKKVLYDLIERYDDKRTKTLSEPYALLEEIREEHHPHLSEARIALAWRKELKPDPDGLLVLGKCKKVTDLDKEFHDYDFIVIVNAEAWVRFDQRQKAALLMHELCHAAVALDKDGEPKRNEKGRQVFRIRKHDVEEFRSVIAQFGLYKSDLEAFFRSLKAEDAAPLFNQPNTSDDADGDGIAGKVGT